MDITPLISSDRQVIQSYSSGRFRISSKVYESPVAVFPDRVQAWDVGNIKNLQAADFEFLPSDLDVILVGVGAIFSSPLIPLKAELKARHINIEVMDTGAACRTYNVLMAEGRRVAALLLPA